MNTGERVIRPLVWTELYDEQGNLAGRFEGGQRWIFPECSCRFEIPFQGVKAGEYKALVIADGGEDEAFWCPVCPGTQIKRVDAMNKIGQKGVIKALFVLFCL